MGFQRKLRVSQLLQGIEGNRREEGRKGVDARGTDRRCGQLFSNGKRHSNFIFLELGLTTVTFFMERFVSWQLFFVLLSRSLAK